ncbi:MAG: Pr6Pr family membrane protein [Candidatus Nanopelagicales bacterium]
MTHATGVSEQTTRAPSAGRLLFAVNAVVAWFGLAMQLVISASGIYPSTGTVLSQLGPGNPLGAAGLVPRVLDFFSYFTIWSNIIVAVVLTMLARQPARDTPRFRVLRLDSLLMITITGLVYAVVLAPNAKLEGWNIPANALLHIITPALTVLVWLIAGPRGWIAWPTIAKSLVIPIVWVVYTLLRGAVIGAYPYPFVDVVKLGYGQVMLNILGVAVLGVVIGAILKGIDALLGRLRRG